MLNWVRKDIKSTNIVEEWLNLNREGKGVKAKGKEAIRAFVFVCRGPGKAGTIRFFQVQTDSYVGPYWVYYEVLKVNISGMKWNDFGLDRVPIEILVAVQSMIVSLLRRKAWKISFSVSVLHSSHNVWICCEQQSENLKIVRKRIESITRVWQYRGCLDPKHALKLKDIFNSFQCRSAPSLFPPTPICKHINRNLCSDYITRLSKFI